MAPRPAPFSQFIGSRFNFWIMPYTKESPSSKYSEETSFLLKIEKYSADCNTNKNNPVKASIPVFRPYVPIKKFE